MKAIVLCFFISILSSQAHCVSKEVEIHPEEIGALVDCMRENTCKEKVMINTVLGENRSGRMLRHTENGNSYVYILTQKNTFTVFIETKEGKFLLDDVFLIGSVTSGFFIPHDGSKTKQYAEKKKNSKGGFDFIIKDGPFFQKSYKEALALAIKVFVDPKEILRRKKLDEI